MGKDHAISFLKDTFPVQNFLIIKSFQTLKLRKCVIHSLNTKNWSSYEEITPNILNAYSAFISCPFIITHCTQEPSWNILKCQYKTTLWTDARTCVTNYTPISPVLVMVMFHRLHQHIDCNNILVQQQIGLREDTSAEDAAHKLTFSVLKSIKN